MLPDSKIKCPATAFKRSCRSVVSSCDCPKFVSIKGTDPQTGAPVERWGCVDSFLPLLLLENAQMSRQAGAAVESFRNDVAKRAESQSEALQRIASRRSQFLNGGPIGD